MQLIYVSTARQDLAETEVTDIVRSSTRNNSLRAVTGLLVFNGANFMQALEGSEAAVDETFRDIVADARHQGVVVVSTKPLAAREFPDWSMGYERLNPDVPEGRRARLLHESMRARIPATVPEETARMFLSFNSLGRSRERL